MWASRRAFARIILLSGSLILSAAGQAQTTVMSAVAWLQAMHHAVHHLNYEGRVVYQVGSDLEVMHLQHQGHPAGEIEYLSVLSGAPHQILRGHGAINHVQDADDGKISPNQHKHILGMNCLFDYQQMAPYYRIYLGKQHRVAGRLAQVVFIAPQDTLRFGRRLYLDQETKLPLRSVLLDHHKQPLAQTLFTELTLKKAPRADRQLLIPMNSALFEPTAAKQRWQFEALPAGFRIKLHHYRSEERREHFIFSDGLSMVSLYIEPWAHGSLQGFFKQGATWILGAHRHNQRMTLLGKVPQETLRQVMNAIRPVP